ncbi:MAG TPA: 1-(5-phosphoribosyl)-5-[(5-phosphoribosylamino)methylideneamino] imidazole-4-carboxamide isomerase [Solirubrobacteraceae bacterium]|nr:1-(5-phosphoribosyl)-5-[(5-phosphoribosylamino)methylideneamino] imidazole-4-carboxamide isomerase [Solirubrobacteraceae bacterium]
MSGPILLWPAVDIRGGRAVRLLRGEFDRETVYDADPLVAALRWVKDGARALHVVDLDGARAGAPANLDHLTRIAAAVDVPVQVGGGLRDSESVARVLAAGAERAILGTAAVRDPAFARAMVAAHGAARILVSVDVRGGRVAAAGWTEQTDIAAAAALAGLRDRGVRRFVFSCIDRDGALGGPDLAALRAACEVVGDGAEIVYSGGVASVEDLVALRAAALAPLRGVIVGTALFEGRLTVAEGQAALDGPGGEAALGGPQPAPHGG